MFLNFLNFNFFQFLFKYILLIMLLQFSPFISPEPCIPQLSSIPPCQFMSMGCTYKFFDCSISYTIFDLSPSILCLPIMLLIPCTFSHLFFLSPSPLKALYVMSISLILFLFQLFAYFLFSLFLGLVLIVMSLLSFYCLYF